jgi:hypothetical protein
MESAVRREVMESAVMKSVDGPEKKKVFYLFIFGKNITNLFL